MNKGIKKYALIWFVLVLMYNLITFATPSVIPGMSKFKGGFWPAYIVIMLAFFGNLFCGYLFFKESEKERTFLNLPLIKISYSALIALLIVGSVFMVTPSSHYWPAMVICVLILGFNVISVIKSQMAADLITETENKVSAETEFIRIMTADAESLMQRAVTDDAKQSVKKVYEAFRYSDPVSKSVLAGIEREISEKFYDFSKEIKAGNDGVSEAEEITALLTERSNKCKAFK